RRLGSWVVRSCQLDEMVGVGERDCLRAAVNAEFRKDVLYVGRKSRRADDELGRDVALAQSLGKSLQYRELAPRQTRPGRGRDDPSWSRASDQSSHAGEQLVRVDRLDEEVVTADQQTGRAVEGLHPR